MIVARLVSVVAAVAACSGSENEQTTLRGRGDAGDVAASGCKPDIAVIQKTVFASRCTSCHGARSPSGALDLESAGVEGRLIGAPASECGGQVLVRPGEPDRSYLLDKLANSKPACGTPMPVSGPLAADDVACISSWIAGLSPSAGGTDGGASTACAPGLSPCSTECVDTKVDPKNCGQCGNTCPVACAESACVATCPQPTTNCSGSCVDVSTSSTNCGACGSACQAGQVCVDKACSCGSAVSFASQLQPILTAECASSGCHGGAQPRAGLALTAGKAYGALVNVASSACAGRTRVVPGAVDKSYLMNKLTGVGMCAGTLMPKTGGALPPAQIDLFRAWICNGAPNN